MKKYIYIKNLILSVIITFLLLYFYSMTPNGKLVLIPFIICSFSILLKNIFLLTNKEKYVIIFNKIFIIGFLLFWFGFLSFSCYISFINKEYSIILFTIPFWLVGFHIIKKYLKKIRGVN